MSRREQPDLVLQHRPLTGDRGYIPVLDHALRSRTDPNRSTIGAKLGKPRTPSYDRHWWRSFVRSLARSFVRLLVAIDRRLETQKPSAVASVARSLTRVAPRRCLELDCAKFSREMIERRVEPSRAGRCGPSFPPNMCLFARVRHTHAAL